MPRRCQVAATSLPRHCHVTATSLTLDTLRSQIDAEKSSQEQILREFRSLKVNPRRR